MWICPLCKTENSGSSQSCRRCRQPKPEMRKTGKWVLLAACAAALALVIAGTAAFTGRETDRPEAAVRAGGPLYYGSALSATSSDNLCGSNAYWQLKDGTLTISGKGAMWDYDSGAAYSIHERLVEDPVTVPWYDRRGEIKKVSVEKGITAIGDHAFDDCRNLESAEIPDSVTSIGKFSFSGTMLAELELPDNLSYIGEGAFLGSSVVYMEIPEGIKKLSASTFESCGYLERLILPEGLTSIESSFDNCRQLGTLIIPDSVEYIGENVFNGACDMLVLRGKSGGYAQRYAQEHGLRFVPLEDSGSFFTGAKQECGENLSWTLKNGVLTVSGKGPMEDYGTCWEIEEIPPWDDRAEEIQKVLIKEGVTYIGINAFRGCFRLSEVELPDSLLSIGDCAFSGCAKLCEVELPNSLQTLGEGAFHACRSLSRVRLPEGIQEIKRGAFCRSGLRSLAIPNNGVRLADYVFDECLDLEEITIPDCVTSLEEGTFAYCISLTGITIPGSVTEIGYRAFDGCDKLTIYAPAGSYAQSYAKENGIPFAAA